ncbi:MAG: glycosyltransferase [Thermodesulfobacteriota bacterium]
MIFVTVGGQMPFDRLIKAMDQWAANQPQLRCLAQVGRGGWRPKHMDWVEILPPQKFREHLNGAELVVAHAGMGSILSALDMGKKLLVMPRRGHLQETRNDHQMATANRLAAMGLVIHARDEKELPQLLPPHGKIDPRRSTSCYASPQLLDAIRSFISEPDPDTLTTAITSYE